METAARLSAELESNACSLDGAPSMAVTSHCWRRALLRPHRQARKGQPLRPLRPFYGKVRPYGPIGPCRFNDLPQVQSGEWELCLATRSTGGWCAGHAAQWYEKRPLRPIRRGRTGCDFPGCSNRHSCRGYCAAHYQQLRQGKPLKPLNLRKGWFKASNGYIYIWEPEHPTPTSKDTSQSTQRSWLQSWGGLFYRRTRCIIEIDGETDNRPENLELWARGQQPPGGRVSDLVEEAVRILRLYAPEKLSESRPRPCRRWLARSPGAVSRMCPQRANRFWHRGATSPQENRG